MKTTDRELIVLAAGCFWCTEAVFQRIEGVESVISGYTGGFIKNPAYREVCMGVTGHAEGIQVEFNPEVVTVEQLLEIFFATHDPTTLNQQGNDKGTQYRSAIFYSTEAQRVSAQKFIETLDKARVFDNKIVTEIAPLGVFYEADESHQTFYDNNTSQPYCQIMINPKLKKLNTYFSDVLKKKETTN
jgi:peptide-methionine (S)-S-oxide reductase